ncbi:MAG: class I SAM-dependent methyltransferase [Candidatus Acidiferrales bacterium]
MEDEKAAVRAAVFTHLAGIVLAPTVTALAGRGVFRLLESPAEWLTLGDIAEPTHANRGYLRVALRLLTSCGWLQQRRGASGGGVDLGETRYALTPEGKIAARLAPEAYGEVTSFIPKALFLEDFLFGKTDFPVLPSLRALVQQSRERWIGDSGLGGDELGQKVRGQIRGHLDGMLIGPAMVALARGGVLARLAQGLVDWRELPGNQASLNLLFDLLETQGWVAWEGEVVRLTSRGAYAAQIATSYGVTVSYLPMFNVLSTLLFGNARFPRVDENGVELLVNRGMNVWGSGGAHTTYFKKVDEIIIEIFNRPIARQPQGICDMGCGDGTFLEHLYEVVKTRTARGGLLDKHPLILVGADFNKVARRVAKQNLRRAKLPTCHIIQGDINRPAQLGSDLEALGLDIHDLLHVRSFLDHNRPYSPPANYGQGMRAGKSSGAFAYLGEEIPADELEENLVRYLRRWAPYVGRFGLLVLELHTLPPELAAANLLKTPVVAYDGTHGYSDQYLVELPIFLECAREAGLQADERYAARFPASELATVSINYFTALAGTPGADLMTAGAAARGE